MFPTNKCKIVDCNKHTYIDDAEKHCYCNEHLIKRFNCINHIHEKYYDAREQTKSLIAIEKYIRDIITRKTNIKN